MAEIKSTLELIMEKTKDLLPTEEEKKAFRKKEVQGKVKGFLVKFIDGLIDLETLKNEIAPFTKTDLETVREIVTRECVDHVDVQSDNKQLFEIISILLGIDIRPLKRLSSVFIEELNRERDIHEETLSARFREKGISGSAVLPNLYADTQWNDFMENVKAKFKEEIQGILQVQLRDN